jgi:hypothetical protein
MIKKNFKMIPNLEIIEEDNLIKEKKFSLTYGDTFTEIFTLNDEYLNNLVYSYLNNLKTDEYFKEEELFHKIHDDEIKYHNKDRIIMTSSYILNIIRQQSNHISQYYENKINYYGRDILIRNELTKLIFYDKIYLRYSYDYNNGIKLSYDITTINLEHYHILNDCLPHDEVLRKKLIRNHKLKKILES